MFQPSMKNPFFYNERNNVLFVQIVQAAKSADAL